MKKTNIAFGYMRESIENNSNFVKKVEIVSSLVSIISESFEELKDGPFYDDILESYKNNLSSLPDFKEFAFDFMNFYSDISNSSPNNISTDNVEVSGYEADNFNELAPVEQKFITTLSKLNGALVNMLDAWQDMPDTAATEVIVDAYQGNLVYLGDFQNVPIMFINFYDEIIRKIEN